MDLEKVLALLTNKHSADLLERHHHALLKVAKRNQRGYIIEDAASLALIIHHLSDRVLNDQSDYIKGLCAIISPLAKPFGLGSESSLSAGRTAVALQSGMVALMDALAELLNSPVLELAVRAASVCEAITGQLPSSRLVEADIQGDTVAMTASLRSSTDGKRLINAAASQAANQQTPQARIAAMMARALVASGFATRLATAWRLACESNDTNGEDKGAMLRVQLLSALAVVTASSTALEAVARAEVFEPLLEQLAVSTFDVTGYEGNMVIDLLFLLATHPAAEGEVQRQACSKAVVLNLAAVLRRLLPATGVVSKQLRNDVLMLGAILANDDQIRALMVV